MRSKETVAEELYDKRFKSGNIFGPKIHPKISRKSAIAFSIEVNKEIESEQIANREIDLFEIDTDTF